MRHRSFAALAALVALPLGGCYQHVVKQSGLGASRKAVFEPNVPEEGDSKDLWNQRKKSTPQGDSGGSSLNARTTNTFQ